jgi:hypothetical protein
MPALPLFSGKDASLALKSSAEDAAVDAAGPELRFALSVL